MKILLVFVALFCIAHCRPSFEPDFEEKNVDQEFHPLLNNNKYPKKDNPTKESNDAHDTSAVYAYRTCVYCLFGNVDQDGRAQHALCRQCSDKNTFNRFCFRCTRRSTSQHEIFAFCYNCL